MKSKRETNQDYEEPENDEEKNDANEADDADDEPEDMFENLLKDDLDEELDENVETLTVIQENEDVDGYTFDKEHYLWCEIKFHVRW